MSIPKILHQTWKDEDVPEDFSRMSLSWRNKHADWEYRLWTDEMNRAFIQREFPSFLSVYDGYETNIQRVDAARYFTVLKYGGFYIDMDFDCLANIEPIMEGWECVFGKEPQEHCLIHNKELITSNAFMGAVPNAEFFQLLCEELKSRKPVTDHPNDKVLETTGPFMLSRVFQLYEKKERIRILDAELIYPLTKEELTRVTGDIQDAGILEKLEKAYGVHHYAGTWWKHKLPVRQ